ncbi:MAG TPA: peptide chain release factor N(5)-glutamine methyltransferase [Dehalococcoidia bacterium]|nr:peptide chain release factor N(5)-glutamine methyltransferase [Dehalococcoidia bacterium]
MSAPMYAALLADAAARLHDVAGDDARLEAEVLLATALRSDRAHVIARLHEPADDATAARFAALLERRLAHEPLAYITGEREFYGLAFRCTPAALIPRPETELLVDFALEEVRTRGVAARIADIGTGTGAVAVAVAVHAPGTRVIATDSAGDALSLARENAQRHGVADRIELRAADLLDGLGVLDVIVANLPYVAQSDYDRLPPEIREHEPRAALLAGPRGTEVVGRLLAEAPAHLASGGALAAEIGDAQADELLAAARRAFRDAACSVIKDAGGRDRVLVVRT